MNVGVNETISEIWSKYLNILEQKYEGISKCLNPPAKEETFKEIESKMGFSLPNELKQLYLCNNGESDKISGILGGLDFISLEDMLFQWETWKRIIEQETEQGMKDLSMFCESSPVEAIKSIYANNGWIPLTYDGSGNHIGIDLDPGENGIIGQVINFGRDEDRKFVIAKNLKDYIKFIIEITENNYFEITEEKNTIFIDFNDGVYATDKYRELLKYK